MDKKQITTRVQAREAKEELLSKFSECPELAGVGITNSKNGYSVKIHLSRPLPNDVKIPSKVNNVPVLTEVVGISYAF
ncbi:MAG: hypothetical protein DSM106950_23680 [Stigonema ocellatum SAG 48.90 = DSM 106950]|nr:hypothetical protein [Stigonema ocellatum SAG 48.90 = DSM 106950]